MEQQKQINSIKAWLGTGSINLFGLLLSGKDTQGARLGELLEAPMFGGGEIIRSSARDDVKEIIGTGALAPTDAYLELVLPYFKKPAFKGKPLILSSVGKWAGEEDSILTAAETSGHPIKAVILINVSEQEILKRWQALQEDDDRGHRTDDRQEALAVRFNEFASKTQPVIEHYRQLGLLIEVNGEQSREDVTEEIVRKLYEKARQNS